MGHDPDVATEAPGLNFPLEALENACDNTRRSCTSSASYLLPIHKYRCSCSPGRLYMWQGCKQAHPQDSMDALLPFMLVN